MKVLGLPIFSLLLSGCFIEVGSGYHKTTHSEGTTSLAGLETEGTGSSFLFSLGLEVDADFLILGVAATGSSSETGELSSLGKGVQFDVRKKLMSLNNDASVYADAAILYGSGSALSYTPQGAEKLTEEGGTTLDLYGGVSLIYKLNANRVSIGAGLGVISRSNEVFGDVKGIGPELRARFTWNTFMSSSRGHSKKSKRGGKGTVYSAKTKDSWMVALNMGPAGSADDDAIHTLRSAATQISCVSIEERSNHSFSAFCAGKPILVSIDTVDGSDFYSVQCSIGDGKKSCEGLFHRLLKNSK